MNTKINTSQQVNHNADFILQHHPVEIEYKPNTEVENKVRTTPQVSSAPE